MSDQARKPLAMVGDSPKPEQDLLRFMRYVEPLVELITARYMIRVGIFERSGDDL